MLTLSALRSLGSRSQSVSSSVFKQTCSSVLLCTYKSNAMLSEAAPQPPYGFPACAETLPVDAQTTVVAPDGTRRHAKFTESLITGLREEPKSLWEAFCSVSQDPGLRERDCFGTMDANRNVAYRSYEQVHDRALALSFILQKKLGVKKGDLAGIYSRNCDAWLTSELALMSRGAVTVALYDTLGADAVSFCVQHSKLRVVFCERRKLSLLADVLADCPTLEHIVVFGDASTGGIDDDKAPHDVPATLDVSSGDGKTRSVTVHRHEQLVADGLADDAGRSADTLPSASTDDTALVMYTSGTTGTPKGVVHTHRSMLSATAGVALMVGGSSHDVHFSYLPLAHIFERVAVFSFLQYGGAVAFFRGDVHELLADIAAVRPTVLIGVPRVFEKIEDGIFNSAGPLATRLIRAVLAASQRSLERGNRQPPWWTAIVTNKTRARLGGRVRMMLSGGAPLAADTHRALRHAFGVPLLQGYGLTETAAITTITHPYDSATGHAGCVVPSVEVRLRPVPDMGYADVDVDGGEVQVRGPCIAQGYYRDEARTRADFAADGWFSTGDIGRFNASGSLSLVDRLKNMFKTSYGEYIAAEKIETELKKSRFVQHVLVHGDSTTPHVVAAAVLEPDYCAQWAAANGHTGESLDSLARNESLRAAVLADFRRVGADAKLQKFEIPHGVALDADDWTVDNGCLTPSFKLKRAPLVERYADEFERIYSSLPR
eukprot:TRINITY_DN2692_c0_g1_i1.p1 TRINITY_DN2692_c0_g1~~TRINITY_DN2692_c0_g1_i1.p1  ORF type:complete len:730 (+),score=394.31 TRINITY_DN2692_c0_g1_i1:44-2191(+)